MEYGGRDQYNPDMNIGLPDKVARAPVYGRDVPESIFRYNQYGIPAQNVCWNGRPDLAASPNDQIQRMAPIRTDTVEDRTWKYMHTPVCERFEAGDSNGDKKEGVCVVNLLMFFFLVMIIFIALNLYHSVQDLKLELSKIMPRV